jgi:hypothetical protein
MAILTSGLPLWAAPPSAEELEQFPAAQVIPGSPPASGTRYWQTPWQPLPASGCYVSVRVTGAVGEHQYEVWQNAWGDEPDDRRIVVRRGPALDKLGPQETAFDGKLITDVRDPKDATKPAAHPGYTRPAMTWTREHGYVLMTCVCPDYLPGSVPLLPALLTSKTGAPGSFVYLGKTRGDVEVEAARRTIWSDGGSLVQLPDGHWRMYLNGFGQVLSLLEAESLEGPWQFRRNTDGGLCELLPDFPKAPNRGGCFPTVLRVSDTNWHLWITDTWVPQAIWHFCSTDGLVWKPYGRQPEITRAAVEGHGIKCLRAYVDPDAGDIVGLLSVWGTQSGGKPEWVLHRSRMPAGPPSPLDEAATESAPAAPPLPAGR